MTQFDDTMTGLSDLSARKGKNPSVDVWARALRTERIMRMLGLEAVLWVAVIVLPGGVLLSPLLVVVVRRRRASLAPRALPAPMDDPLG